VMRDDAKGQLAFGRAVLEPPTVQRPAALAGLEDFARALEL
jgi:hypothetical protein